MRHGSLVVLLVAALQGTAAADGFVEVSGGMSIPKSDGDWVALAEPSPKLAVRAGTLDRKYRSWKEWGDAVVSGDWTPLRTDDPDSSAHRFRVLIHLSLSARMEPVRLSTRVGFGYDLLRLGRPSESRTLSGWAFELGAGLWCEVGDFEIGGELGMPIALNGNTIVGDLDVDTYLGRDLDLLIGVRALTR